MLSAGKRAALVHPALAVGGALAPFLPVLAGAWTLVAQDSQRLYAPLRGPVVQALRALRLPLWNPHEAAGVPLFAEALHGVLHPVSVVTALLAPGAPLDVLILAYLALAAGGAFTLARALGASPSAALLGALALGLSGYAVSMAANVLFLAGLAGASWCIAAMRWSAVGGGPRWGIPAVACAVAAAAFTGDFQSLLWALLLGGALAAAAGGWRAAARAAAGAAVGLLAAGIQLLPSWLHLQRTTRAVGRSGMEAMQWPLEPWRLVEWVVPGFFGGTLGPGDAAPFLLLGGATGYAVPFVQSVFVGSVVILLAAAAPAAPREAARTRRVLLLALGTAIWLALGHRLGATQATSPLPLLGSLRYAEKWMAPITLCFAMLAALGADALWSAEPPRRLLRATPVLLAAAVLAWLGPVLAPGAFEALFAWFGAGAAPQPIVQVPADAARRATAHLAAGAFQAAVSTAAFWALLRHGDRLQVAWRRRALVALVYLEALAAIPSAARLADARPPPQPLLRATPRAGPPVRIVLAQRDGDRTLPPTREGEDPLVAAARLGVAPFNVAQGVDNMDRYGALVPRRWSNLAAALGEDLAWAVRRFATTHGVVPPPRDAADEAFAARAVRGGEAVLLDERSGAAVWAVPHRPWATFPAAAVALPSPQDVHPRLLDAIAAADPTVLVESTEPVVAGPGVVRAVLREAEWIRIEAEAPGEALLVVNDAYDPGWRATIDGSPVEVLPADILVRAVRWPAGRHVLEMRYDPPEVGWGLAISLLGLAAAAVAALRAPRRS